MDRNLIATFILSQYRYLSGDSPKKLTRVCELTCGDTRWTISAPDPPTAEGPMVKRRDAV